MCPFNANLKCNLTEAAALSDFSLSHAEYNHTYLLLTYWILELQRLKSGCSVVTLVIDSNVMVSCTVPK